MTGVETLLITILADSRDSRGQNLDRRRLHFFGTNDEVD